MERVEQQKRWNRQAEAAEKRRLARIEIRANDHKEEKKHGRKQGHTNVLVKGRAASKGTEAKDEEEGSSEDEIGTWRRRPLKAARGSEQWIPKTESMLASCLGTTLGIHGFNDF